MNLLSALLQRAILQGAPIFYGVNGEILTEKAGNLNLGIPDIMHIGGVLGLIAAFFYKREAGDRASGLVGLLISLCAALLVSMLAGFLYSFLTVTLRANQDVMGLSLTTFGVDFDNFFGGSLSQLAGGVEQIFTKLTAAAYRQSLPGLSGLSFAGKAFFSFGSLTYLSIALSLCPAFLSTGTRRGLEIRAVGEDSTAADVAGVDVNRVKYVSTMAGAAFAGLGGLCFVMKYFGGTWANDGFGDRSWFAVTLVILSVWNARRAIWGSFLFGGLYILYLYIPGLNRPAQELFKMLPYLATILVLIQTDHRNRPEDQPSASLGFFYFRKEHRVMDIRIKVLLAEILLLGLQILLYFGVGTFEGKPYNVAKKIDGHIPFVLAFVYIYVLWFPLVLLFPPALFRVDSAVYACYQMAILLDIAPSLICYLAYPVSLARPKAPDTVSGRAMKLVLRGSYKGSNCAPSMHCSMCYPMSHFVGTTPGLPSAVAAIVAPVALGIVVSTLFTKQHVVIDALTALPLAAVYILIGNRPPFTALLHWILSA